jgi:hypothetical protein
MTSEPDVEMPSDGHGYRVTSRDLSLLSVSPSQVLAWRDRRHPLGMSQQRFGVFVSDLRSAIALDGLSMVDVRLQGSSARFFSGAHKPMPVDRDDIAEEIVRENGFPETTRLDDAEAALNYWWPDPDNRPRRRPFDVMHKLGFTREPSDYDIQVSSEELRRRAEEYIHGLRLTRTKIRVDNPDYGFIRKEIYLRICPALLNWSTIQTEDIGRKVSLACFDENGPAELTGDDASKSSHFREDDWRLVAHEHDSEAP